MPKSYILINKKTTLSSNITGAAVTEATEANKQLATTGFTVSDWRLQELGLFEKEGILIQLNNKPAILQEATWFEWLAPGCILEVPVSKTKDTGLRYMPEDIDSIPAKNFKSRVIAKHLEREDTPEYLYANDSDIAYAKTHCTCIRLYDETQTKQRNGDCAEFRKLRVRDIDKLIKDEMHPGIWITHVSKNRKGLFESVPEKAQKTWHDPSERPTKKQCHMNQNRFFGWNGTRTYLISFDGYDNVFRKPVDHGGIINNEVDKDLKLWAELPAPPTAIC